MQKDGLRTGQPTGRRVALKYFTSVLILSDCTKGQHDLDVESSDRCVFILFLCFLKPSLV